MTNEVRNFRLRFDRHEVELPPGEFVVGRGEGCGLILDDPSISRRHALFRITTSTLTVEDLGSRNGVRVNGKEAQGAVSLNDGDRVEIGDAMVTVLAGGPRPLMRRRSSANTMTAIPLPREDDTSRSRLAMVELAIAKGDLKEAELHLGSVAIGALNDIQAQRTDVAMLAVLTDYCLRVAGLTEKHSWIDWVLHLHRASARVPSGQAIDELYAVARKLKYPYTAALRSYMEVLEQRGEQLTPAEKFLLNRLEGLVRMLRA